MTGTFRGVEMIAFGSSFIQILLILKMTEVSLRHCIIYIHSTVSVKGLVSLFYSCFLT